MYYSFLGWKKNETLFADIKQTTNGVIIYDELLVPSFFSSYVLKPLVSNNSPYYHAYSFTSWENEYLASSYGKDSLGFFPSEFIKRIEQGGSFREFNLNEDLPFYVKQLEEQENIFKVRFNLRQPQDTEIPFYVKPFAAYMTQYSAQYVDIDDFDVQYVNGKRFVFVKKNQLLSDRLTNINILN